MLDECLRAWKGPYELEGGWRERKGEGEGEGEVEGEGEEEGGRESCRVLPGRRMHGMHYIRVHV